MKTTYLALYRGETVANAKLVTVSAHPEIVSEFAERLLELPSAANDPVIGAVEEGRRNALWLVRDGQDT